MMYNFTSVTGGVTAAKGFTANGVYCGVKKSVHAAEGEQSSAPKKNDLAVVYSEKPCAAAAVYTQNKVKGAPITVTQKHLENGVAQAVIVNSGNANTCNADGVEKAERMCALAAEKLGISADDMIIASTGVIGQVFPIEPIEKGIAPLVGGLTRGGNEAAAEAIMTTDTVKKQAAVSFTLNGVTCTVGGMTKGSGMIHPNMATMLSFITTDCDISAEMLKKAVYQSARVTYNMISVDGDTSTNDMCCIMANGMAGNKKITAEDESYEIFYKALLCVNTQLARMMAKDGEGATKLLECFVCGAPDENTARKVAKSVVCSSLLKAAMFGEDANWGRVLCAIGYTEGDFDINKTDVSFISSYGKIDVCKNGAGVPFSEEEAAQVLKSDEITIKVNLQSGDFNATVWGCDLTYDYVKINGDYRT